MAGQSAKRKLERNFPNPQKKENEKSKGENKKREE